MENCFDLYSQYYDLLYQDKNYAAESDYINRLLSNYLNVPKSDRISLLELGCGTGKHAEYLCENGYNIYGIDISESMVQIAKQKENSFLTFDIGDVRNYRCNRKFDAVVSLFHVASYQVENKDLLNFFKTAYHHLEPGGVFIFDFWYGPAVLTERPSIKIKRLVNDKIQITRLAEPVMFPDQNKVDVHYEILFKKQGGGITDCIKEVHSMRYFFIPEIEILLQQAGFIQRGNSNTIGTYKGWLSDDMPGMNTWACVCVAQKA